MSDSEQHNNNTRGKGLGVHAARPTPPTGGTSARDVVAVQLERLARTGRRRLVADIVAKIGIKRLEMAEDVVQDAVIAAMKTWPYKGMPDNPAAWLNRVARNKAYDRLRREGREQSTTAEDGTETDLALSGGAGGQETPDKSHAQFFGAQVRDPELKLMFLCCHDAISEEDRLMLTLKVVSGFTARDIAALFLKNEAAVGQRLARAKRKLRTLDSGADGGTDGGTYEDADDPAGGRDTLAQLSRFAVKARAPTVLKVIYLMFALGYAPRRGDSLILQDVAFEAVRLARVMADTPEITHPACQALAALLALQASRFNARVDVASKGGLHDGPVNADSPTNTEKLVLLKDQNRALWDRGLIDDGLRRLKAAQTGTSLSRYHLEAGIAAIHATAPRFDKTDWSAICALYDKLEAMTGSPVVAVSACAAQAFAGAPEKAFIRLEALRERRDGGVDLTAYAPYHTACAEILRMLGRPMDAAASYRAALTCDASAPVAAHLHDRLASCI